MLASTNEAGNRGCIISPTRGLRRQKLRVLRLSILDSPGPAPADKDALLGRATEWRDRGEEITNRWPPRRAHEVSHTTGVR